MSQSKDRMESIKIKVKRARRNQWGGRRSRQ